MKLTVDEAIRRIKRKRPKNELDIIIRCGLPLRYLSYGKFRIVFEIVGVPLVVKFPLHNRKKKANLHHTDAEISNLRKVRRSYRRYDFLQSLVPKVHHYDKASGLVVMDKYRKPRNQDHIPMRRIRDRLESTDKTCGDLFTQNFGVDKDGNLKILDLGYLLTEVR